jgi:two-component system response regulator DevR
VVALIVEGLDNAAIGERMFVSPNTARTHVQNILRKLEVSSRLEAASLASTFGLLDRFPIEGKDDNR